MRIAVDARPLAAPLTGIGRYTRSLLQYMIPRGHQWFLYSDRPFELDIPSNPRVSRRYGDASGGTPGSLRWAQWYYSRWAIQDVVDLFWSPRHHLPLFLRRDICSVVTIHDLVWRKFPETMQTKNLWLERMLMGPSIRAADQVICVSKFTASEVSRHYPGAMGKCRVIYEAAEQFPTETSRLSKIPDNYLLFVGTLEPRKNLPRLLKAYALARTETSLPPLVLVGGSGWGGEDLGRRIGKLGLGDSVILTGYVGDAQLQSLYAGAQALLMPSLYEGFGLPVLEAMWHGVPAIAASTSSLPEVVGDAGLLINPYSERELADAIKNLVTDESLRRDLSVKALERVTSFSWETAAGMTLDLFADTLQSHEPKPYRHKLEGSQFNHGEG